MNIQFNKTLLVIMLSIPVFNLANASELAVPNFFSAGTPAIAADMNANFDATADAVNDNNTRIETLLDAVESLRATVDVLRAENAKLANNILELQVTSDVVSNEVIPGLNEVLSVELDEEGQPATVIFSGINLVLNNGNEENDTRVVNGRGNLIVGYNELNETGDLPEVCSDQQFSVEECESNGATLAVNHRSGSHNIVVGRGHSYAQYGGLVSGTHNRIIGVNSSITGGTKNLALGGFSTITGGHKNQTFEEHSSVSGGRGNKASGEFSSLSGGSENQATGRFSSVSGGRDNIASGARSSISGGQSNRAQARSSSISGGADNYVFGDFNWRVSDEFSTD